MSFATSIRANHRRMCTYTPPSKSHFVSPFESALPNRPRNCTFHSRLKSRSFNAHLRPSANSFPFCTSKKRGETIDPVSHPQIPDSAPSAPLPCLPPCPPHLSALRVGSCLNSSRSSRGGANPSHPSLLPAKRPRIFNNLQTQFRATPVFPSGCAFPGEGGYGISNPFAFKCLWDARPSTRSVFPLSTNSTWANLSGNRISLPPYSRDALNTVQPVFTSLFAGWQ